MLRSGSRCLARLPFCQANPCPGLDLLGAECLSQFILIQPIQYSGSRGIVFLLGNRADLFPALSEYPSDQGSVGAENRKGSVRRSILARTESTEGTG